MKSFRELLRLDEASYEKDMSPNKPVIVKGVKGMKSTPFTKKFKNQAAYEKWADSDAAGDYTIHQVMNEEVEEIDELHRNTLQSIAKKAKTRAQKAYWNEYEKASGADKPKIAFKANQDVKSSNLANKMLKKGAYNEDIDQVDEASSTKKATVDTQKYDWGTMKVVRHGHDFSIPLHPEHHQAIAKLKHGETHNFKDETNRRWSATRDGDKVHFLSSQGGTHKTSVPHHTMKEDVESAQRDLDAKIAAIIEKRALEIENISYIDEVLTKSDPAEKWIHDFVHSDNPKFRGKTKEERRKMAIGAYYGKQREK